MSWHVLTSDNVLEEFTPQEQATLKNIQSNQDNLPAILTRAINRARGAIRAGGYPVDVDGTTPDQLDMEIIAIARWAWLVAMPNLKALQTPERKAAHDDAIARLDKIGQGQLKVEPVTAGTNLPSGNWNSENKIVSRTHPIPRPSSQSGTTDGTGYANPTGPSDS